MALIERYLHAVRGYLPPDDQDDIIAELSEDIHAQAEDRAAALGRPLSETDEAELLKRIGNPLRLAARYRRQQHLIGPALLPFYWKTLKVALGIGLLIHVVVTVGLALAGRPPLEAAGVLFHFPLNGAVTIFAWVTIVFAGLDAASAQLKVFDEWDPRKLPPIERDGRPSRAHVLWELAFGAVALVWWLAIPRWPSLIFGPAAKLIAFAPDWQPFYLAILATMLVSLAAELVTFVRPGWSRVHIAARVVAGIVLALTAGYLLRSSDIVTAAASGSAPEAELARVVSMGLRTGFVITAVIKIAQAAVDVWKFAAPAGLRALG